MNDRKERRGQKEKTRILTPRTVPSTPSAILSDVKLPAIPTSPAFWGIKGNTRSVTMPAHELVSVVVTSLAKTPLAAAQRPERRA
jgi:hypothetical protein